MRADIAKWCRACVTCASRRVGQAAKPPLNPIPVSGPFDLVGADVIKFPKSQKGNRYAVVFMDYGPKCSLPMTRLLSLSLDYLSSMLLAAMEFQLDCYPTEELPSFQI